MNRDLPFLKHILDETAFLLKETEDITFDAFIKDELLKRGCTRSLEIIGEATKNISPELKNKHKDIEWKRMAGIRDKIIHYYFGVNWDIVWSVLQEKIPELKQSIATIIKDLEAKNNLTF
ncbi:MAG: DUF86 domain-containing protein [bacterium (Candidatus Ratteibacteria) CG23_combo_of_CG06-09_8_20_14_all_48_7]|uniref:DUF86 domain-containing protein n=1 Tax=bacterium (Candidatus Ratteibacteria) CG23_combo_of_CG06-09_8_20_14_all_48_7 TaxID=2014292 RepID=A0A2G9YBN8_9BACT|nr:MAG: DUF86 domain-containing protein [bacterium (Candidatus Ratteibacteria) CG23_combo_of_CG06-09_8_20_14_all_48_7]